MSATGNVRASLAAEGFATESTTAAATAEERKSQRDLEDAALDAAVAITQVGSQPAGPIARRVLGRVRRVLAELRASPPPNSVSPLPVFGV
jgi:hypothetical protein